MNPVLGEGHRTITPMFPFEQSIALYAREFDAGLVPDRVPYGLENLPAGWSLKPTQPRGDNWLVAQLRRAVRHATQIDFISAIQEQYSLRHSDVIYAHTEMQSLAAAFVLMLSGARGPLLVAQSVWLFAELPDRNWLARWVTRKLLRRVDIFVHNARPNLLRAEQLLPDQRHCYVPFGVSLTFADGTSRNPDVSVPLILSVGGDRARDWATFAEAVDQLQMEIRVRIATGSRLVGQSANTVVRRTQSIAELKDLYRSATCMVIPVRPNSHASGITAILEAAAAGTPVIASRCGGLEDYFNDDEIMFVEPSDPLALGNAIQIMLTQPEVRERYGQRIQAAFVQRRYDNLNYWIRISDVLQGRE